MQEGWLQLESEKDTIAFDVDERVYSVTALLRAAYWFTDRAYVFVSKPAEWCLRVHLKSKPTSLEVPSRVSLSDLAGEFSNQLIDHQLRETIEERTGAIRELLVTKALAEAGLVQDEPPGTAVDSVAQMQNSGLDRSAPQ